MGWILHLCCIDHVKKHRCKRLSLTKPWAALGLSLPLCPWFLGLFLHNSSVGSMEIQDWLALFKTTLFLNPGWLQALVQIQFWMVQLEEGVGSVAWRQIYSRLGSLANRWEADL